MHLHFTIDIAVMEIDQQQSLNKPNPFIHDAGHLMVTDPNPLTSLQSADPASLEQILAAEAKAAAQSLVDHLLTSCPISSTSDGVIMSLPKAVYQLPREKPIPTPKPPTKWQQFAKKRGIAPKPREGKLVYDEEKKDWVPKYGYKGANKRGENDWLVEIDEKKEKKAKEVEGGEVRGLGRRERKEAVKRNERRQRTNEKGPRRS